jgi:hypothetical protein
VGVVAAFSPFRVILYNVDTAGGRGRGTLAAIIDDAKDIGGSEMANAPGECFFTLPYNHPQISQCVPLLRHYRIDRYDATAGAYTTVFAGLLDDYDARPNEVVFYGTDYLGLLKGTISHSATTYTSQYVGNIITDQLTAARAEANSRVNFITVGTIDTTSTTTTVLTSYEERLPFISGLADILMSSRSVHSIIQVTPRSSTTGTYTFRFQENQGSDKESVRLEYGGLVTDFHYAPGYGDAKTRINAIGQKREGASLLYSTQLSGLSEATYGWIAGPRLFLDIVDQTALDSRTLRAAKAAGRIGKNVGLAVRVNGLGPWAGYDLGDNLRVVIERGPVSVNGLFTLWGLQWIGHRDGSEDLLLNLLPKDT